MITETKTLSKTFLDFDNDPYVWDKVDKLLAEVDETKTISFEEAYIRTKRFLDNLRIN